MIMENIQLFLFGTNSNLLEHLKHFSAAISNICFEHGLGPQVVIKARLDAMWVSLMEGIELFGVTPPFPLHEARVITTTPTQSQQGMPKYVIVGVATSDDDPKTPEYNLRVVLSALLKAVHEFNLNNPDQIQRIGILPEDLDLKRIDPSKAIKIISEVFKERSLQNELGHP
jgi:hypothetical protein